MASTASFYINEQMAPPILCLTERYVVAGGTRGHLSIMDLACQHRESTQLCKHRVVVEVGRLRGQAFDCFEETLVTGNEDGTVRTWDLQTGYALPYPPKLNPTLTHPSYNRALRKTLPGQHSKWIIKVLAPSPSVVISSSQDPLVVVWDVHLGSPRHILQGYADDVQDLAQGGDLLFGGARDGAVYLWNLTTGQQVHVLQDNLNRSVAYVALNQDKRLLATILLGGRIEI